VTEGDAAQSEAQFAVSLGAPSSQPLEVSFQTADDTATAPGDYEPASGTLSFAPGEVNKTVTVKVNGDTLDESDERFFVNLSSAQGAPIADAQGEGRIKDDDPRPAGLPAVSIGDRAVTEGDEGLTDASFTASLSHPSDQAVRVDFQSADDSARAPDDYLSTSGRLTFAAGEVNKAVTVQVRGDRVHEPDERFRLELSNAQSATLADGQAIGTITDDDPAGSLPGPGGPPGGGGPGGGGPGGGGPGGYPQPGGGGGGGVGAGPEGGCAGKHVITGSGGDDRLLGTPAGI